MNNLTVSKAKTTEVIIYNSWRKQATTYATTAARHHQSQFTPRLKRDTNKETVSFRTHPTSHQRLFAVTVWVACAPSSRYDWRRPMYCLPVSRRRKDSLRLFKIEWLHHGVWPLPHRRVPPPQQTVWLLSTRPSVFQPTCGRFWGSAVQQTL